jgi:hypothetical protein
MSLPILVSSGLPEIQAYPIDKYFEDLSCSNPAKLIDFDSMFLRAAKPPTLKYSIAVERMSGRSYKLSFFGKKAYMNGFQGYICSRWRESSFSYASCDPILSSGILLAVDFMGGVKA